jgi:membrane protein YqaA with SNARE-associated domain
LQTNSCLPCSNPSTLSVVLKYSQMTNQPTSQEQLPQKATSSWLKRNFLSALIFTFVLAITVFLFFIQDKLTALGDAGYLGVFLVSAAANATVVLPMPSLLLILPLATVLNPLYVGLVAAGGGAIGEMTAYLAGFSGRGIWGNNKAYLRAVGWLRKWGIWVVFVVSATPLPMDVMGLAAGNLRFPAWRYLIGCIPGKIIKYVSLAYATAWGWDTYVSSESFRENLLAFGVGVGVAILTLGLALLIENLTWKKHSR